MLKDKKKIALIIISILFSIIFVIFMGLSFYLKSETRRQVYNTKDSKEANKVPTVDFEQHYVENENGDKLDFILIPNESSEKLVIYFHGNAGRTVTIIEKIAEKTNILSPSYPGYSNSEGLSSEKSIEETVDLAFKFAENELGFSRDNIIIYGHSFGGSPALYGASKYGEEIQGTIIVNVFNSLFSICWDDYKILCWQIYNFHNSEMKASEFKGKMRHYHSINDKRVTLSKGKSLSSKITLSDYKFTEIEGEHSVFNIEETLKDFDF